MSVIVTSRQIDAKPRSKYRRNITTVGGGTYYGGSSGSSGTIIESGLELNQGQGILIDKNVLGKTVYTISHGDTSSAESTQNTGVNLISNIALDQFGHITELNSSDVTNSLDKRYLRKDVDDKASGNITFEQEIRSPEFSALNQGWLINVSGNSWLNNIDVRHEIKSTKFITGWGGTGWSLTSIGKATLDSALVRSDIFLGGVIGSESFASGFTGWGIEMNVPDCAITTDFLTVRKSMKVYELVYSQIYGLGGSVMITDLNKILTVEDKGDYFSVVIDKMEDSMRMNLRAGDIVRMQRSFGVNIRYFYGEILSVSSDTFDIKIIDGDDVPEVGDVVFRMGNKTDTSRQGVIYLTSSDDKAPYIDVLDGITDQSMFEKVKVRMGNISGIRTKKGQQLKGYGIYAEGAVFENSTVFLENGDTIEQYFSVMEGRFNSEIDSIRNDISSSEGNILRNSSFTDNTFYWVTNDNISIINVGGNFLWFNANFYADKRSVTDIYRDGNRNVLRVLNATIYQPNANLNFKDNAEEGSYSFSLFYKVRRAGILKVGISGTELYEEQVLTEITSYERLYKIAEWNKEGDFEISFTGEILIYGVSLFEDAMAGTIAKMWTQIYQNEEQIALRATKEYVDSGTGAVREHYDSEISVMAEEIALKATKFYVDSETSRVTSEWQSGLSIKADQIEASVKQWTNGQLSNYSTLSQTANGIQNAIYDLNLWQYATTVWTSNQITNAVSGKTSIGEVKTMLTQTATDYKINISAFPLATQRVSNSFFNFNVNGMSLNRRIEVGTGENSDSFVCQGGISANTYDGTNHNIFLWAGGTFQQASINQSTVKIRHDGSGYLASGNISWNVPGDLTVRGRFESSDSGNRIIINPSIRNIEMIATDKTVATLGFVSDTLYNGADFRLYLYDYTGALIGKSVLGGGNITLHDGTSDKIFLRVSGGTHTNFEIHNLPTSRSQAYVGELYLDGEIIKRKNSN